MKVLCIEGGNIPCWTQIKKDEILTEGQIYNVIDQEIFVGTLYYVLEELGFENAFDSDLFVPLSDVDETEFVRETIQEKQITN
jgi:hypothetical protein